MATPSKSSATVRNCAARSTTRLPWARGTSWLLSYASRTGISVGWKASPSSMREVTNTPMPECPADAVVGETTGSRLRIPCSNASRDR